MKIRPRIRFAREEDLNRIIDLCNAHADYEKAKYVKENKEVRLLNDLFSNPPKLYCLVVESDRYLIGYATYMKQYSTWDAAEYIYMDCLYLKEFARGLGIGKKLLKKIQEEGKKLSCAAVQWQTPDFNTKGIKFYKALGAISKRKERFFLNIR